jgi:hypothetical protein
VELHRELDQMIEEDLFPKLCKAGELRKILQPTIKMIMDKHIGYMVRIVCGEEALIQKVEAIVKPQIESFIKSKHKKNVHHHFNRNKHVEN